MNTALRLSPILMVLALAYASILPRAEAAGQASPSADSLAALKAEYDAASKLWTAEFRTAVVAVRKQGEAAAKAFRFDKPSPSAEYSPRFLAIAEKDPLGPEALDAIKMALQTGFGPKGKQTRAKAIKILADHYTTSPKILGVIKVLARFKEDDANAFIDDVIKRNPDRRLHAKAYRVRADSLAGSVRFADLLKKDEASRASFEASRGKDFVARTLANGEKARLEIDAVEKILREKYADVVADISIGSPIPPLVSEDLEGKTTSLADFKGKVVVLDIWATWCGPCKAMIPHERTLVARLKDKPFALVSISVDAEKQTLVDFLAKEPMPWNHWWNGANGKLIDTLSIQHYPTIFVLDSKGVIRFKEVRGEELEKAVNLLLDEAVTAKPGKAA